MAAARLTTYQGEPAVTLVDGDLEATFLPSLTMLGVSVRHRGDELLAPADVERYRTGHTTGIPLLYPWANRLGAWTYRAGAKRVHVKRRDAPVDQQGLPIHGTANGLPFDIVDIKGARLRARLDATTHARITASFPFPHVVELDVRITDGDTLAVTTTVHATGTTAVPISFGFHPYFRLAGSRAALRMRLPSRTHLALDDRQLPTGDTTSEPADDEPIGRRTFDDLYRLGRDRRFELTDRRRHRNVAITFDRGFPYAQVFAPPGSDFVCIEPMTASVNALVTGDAPRIEPGDRYRATWRVRVRATST